MTTDPLPKGSVIGILGSGQLGRMLAQAAAELGFQTHIYAPDDTLADTPAGQVSDSVTQGAYEDQDKLMAFADAVDVVTYEFENVPQSTAAFLSATKPVRPGQKALEVAQDRWVEKNFIRNLGIGVAGFQDITSLDGLQQAWEEFGGDGILKTRRFGYDGKGQWRINARDQLEQAFTELAGRPAIVEQLIPFEKEVSVLAARSVAGEIAIFDCVENVHANHILKYSYAPAELPESLKQDGKAIAEKMLTALDYVGVLAIELFVCDNALLINEIAPRVHNSGHWTMDACAYGQFHQHILAVTGQSLADPARTHDAVMTNLIGDDIQAARSRDFADTERLHDYGKKEIRDGRKMGHINALYPLNSGRRD
ncbi:MAG: 5-(carboxyamino)imidazole ribonucleotide synthase [Parvibaculales bacterium]